MKYLRKLLALCVCMVAFSASGATVAADAATPGAAKEPPKDLVLKGDAKCTECHDENDSPEVLRIGKTIHGVKGDSRTPTCTDCHGASELHIKEAGRGDKKSPPTDVVFGEKQITSVEGQSAACLSCHSKSKGQMLWRGSAHEGQKVSCASCHKIHGTKDKLLVKQNQSELCFTCHANVRADLYKRSKHPLHDSTSASGEGKMTCSSCHNVHGAKGEKLVDAKSFNDKCFECHGEKKAPVLWEHSPVKEDCMTCHNSHGSSNDKMLVTKVPRLCQQCHMQGRHQTGTLATNSIYAFNRGCLNCHSMVHGSNNPSGAVLQR